MRNESEHHDKPGSHNQRIGRELYNKEQRDQHPNQRYGYRGQQDRKWDEGNFFHTGPSPRGAQDRNRADSNYRSEQRSFPAQQGSSREQHYGSRSDSPYRNENRYLNHGQSDERPYSSRTPMGGGSLPGNYNEPPTSQDSLWREGPGGRSRYKETDFRYGSGSHNWYSEGRYSPDVEPENSDKRGFFTRVRDTWDDIMNADDPEYRPHNQYDPERRAEQLSSRQRYGGEAYRDRNFDSGYEGGPRWADETDSGKDNYYKDRDRDQHNRR